MGKAGKIIAVDPPYAIPGGEVAIDCDGFNAGEPDSACFIGGEACRMVAAVSPISGGELHILGMDERDVTRSDGVRARRQVVRREPLEHHRRRGLQVELAPADLLSVVGALVAPIARGDRGTRG